LAGIIIGALGVLDDVTVKDIVRSVVATIGLVAAVPITIASAVLVTTARPRADAQPSTKDDDVAARPARAGWHPSLGTATTTRGTTRHPPGPTTTPADGEPPRQFAPLRYLAKLHLADHD